METETRGFDCMNFLKDITQGLRGRDGARRDERTLATDLGRDGGRAGSTAESDDASGDTHGTATRDQRSDEHVCSFCQTEFDASRGSCPECDAEIVHRGER